MAASFEPVRVASPWRHGFKEWAFSDGVTWLYLAKVLVAAFATYWIALRLELPQPRTAVITVFIVMQPQSGQVFAKGFYRFIGSLAGSVAVVTLMALFAQNTELFLGGLALWIGVCSTGAARNRNFRAYGWVLAGYTAAMIGLPALAHPDDVFMSAVWRVLEITLGILCSTVVSAALLPQTSSAAMHSALYRRFGTFAKFVVEGLNGRIAPADFTASNLRFISEAVGLESLRSVSVFEDPHVRLRSGRLSRLNSEFMGLTTRFNALHQLCERRQGGALVTALEPALQALADLLADYQAQGLTPVDAHLLAERLAQFQDLLPGMIRRLREGLESVDGHDQEDFHTASELLYRFVDDLREYAVTHASLATHSHARENAAERYQPQTNWLAALASGFRGAFIIAVMGAFWVATAWPSGATMTLVSAATIGLSAATPNPRRMAFQMACGTLLGAFAGFVEMFYVYPQIDGFALLCLALAPVFMFGTWLAIRPTTVGYGLGLLIFFSIGSVPDNLTVYNPYGFINDYIAMVLGMMICAAAGSIILPPNARWLWRRLESDLRGQVLLAIGGRLRGLRAGFESRTRDLTHHAYGLAAGRPDVQRNLLRWLFVVQEVGHAVIELRLEQERLPVHPSYAENTPWRQSIRALGRALARLFKQPGGDNLQRALHAVDQAIACVQASDEPFGPHFDTSVLRRVLSYLHFIRTSLLDPQSPLEPPAHAA